MADERPTQTTRHVRVVNGVTLTDSVLALLASETTLAALLTELQAKADLAETQPVEGTVSLADGATVALADGTEVGLADGATVTLKGSTVVQDVVIANGQSLSGTIALGAGGERQLVGLQMPAAWTAASLTFAVSFDGATFVPLYWDGAEYTILAAGGAAASLGVSLEPSAFAGWPFVRVRSGTSGTPVNQGAERTLKALTRAV
jgi:hypothetical protein